MHVLSFTPNCRGVMGVSRGTKCPPVISDAALRRAFPWRGPDAQVPSTGRSRGSGDGVRQFERGIQSYFFRYLQHDRHKRLRGVPVIRVTGDAIPIVAVFAVAASVAVPIIVIDAHYLTGICRYLSIRALLRSSVFLPP